MSSFPTRLPAVLHDVFGFADWRPGQARAAGAVDAGRDALIILPTGGGKSLCYQAPAVAAWARGEGATLVVSPLIALMRDQVAALRALGVPAAALYRRSRREEARSAEEAALGAALIYASPERLKSARFRRWLGRVGIGRLAVDEAHCISSWGHDFRPDYLRLGELARELEVPIAAFTATATPLVAEEIVEVLGLRQPIRVQRPFRRPELRFSVEHVAGKARQKRVAELAEAAVEHGRVVVYVIGRKRSASLARALRERGLPTVHYHAGRTARARSRAEAAFVEGRRPILVATTAFGMGVDLPDVRAVIHAQCPGSLAGYVQAAGRAGRDGEDARCVLLYGAGDAVIQSRLRGEDPTPGATAGWKALVDYAWSTRCRQAELAAYLGESDPPDCGRCDACTRPEAVEEQVRSGRQAIADKRARQLARRREEAAVRLNEEQLDAVVAFVDALRKPLGRGLIVKGLRGSRAKRVKRKKLMDNPQYGALRGLPEVAVFRALDELLEAGRLAPRGRKYPTLWIPNKRIRKRRSARSRPARPPIVAALERLRRREARRRRVKPYQVIDNATIRRIHEARPASLEELAAVRGMGPKRLARYGDTMLRIVAEAGA